MAGQHRFASLFAIGLMVPGLAFAQAATVPSSQPSSPNPFAVTPEQKAVLDALNASDPTQPAPKLDLLRVLANGSPNPNFGKSSPVFYTLHESFLKRAEQPVDLLFLGDSITQWWSKAPDVFKAHFGQYDWANFGIAADRTENVLWRIEHGELDRIKPKVVVLLIGTNNALQPQEKIVAGVTAVARRIREKLPGSKLLLLGIFPRNRDAAHNGKPDTLRSRLQAVNVELAKLDDAKNIRYLGIWKEFLSDDGTLSKDIMPDALHPSARGYEIWASAMQPLLDEMMKE